MAVAETRKTETTHHLTRMPFSEVNREGAYICNETGDLFRVPEDALVSGRSPVLDIVSKKPMMVTQISNDPWLPISRARQLAADADLYIDF
jgi:hypothetical protein